jgi:tetratricopeptide (TPR) repeat protein
VQDQVAQQIAEALTARLAAGERVPGERFAPGAEAFESYMRALEAIRGGTINGLRRGIELLERAVNLEPRYADAWVALGSACLGMVDSGYDFDPAWQIRAEQHFLHALKLAPDHSFGNFNLGALDLVRGRKREAYRRFVEVRPRLLNNMTYHHYIAYLYRLCDQLDLALDVELQAHRVDPSSPWPCWSMSRVHLLRGEFQPAREWLDRVHARFGPLPRTRGWEMACLRGQGRFAEALEFQERSGAGEADFVLIPVERAICLFHLGRAAEAVPLMARIHGHAEVDMDWAAYAAALHGLAGDADRAFERLGRAVALGNDTLSLYRDPTLFAPLHSDPRWPAFVSAMEARVARDRDEFPWPPA